MAFVAIRQFGVDFIRQNHDVGSAQYSGDCLQMCAPHDCAGRIVGEGKDQQLCARSNGRLQLLRRQSERVLGARGDRHGHAAGQLGNRRVADERRFHNEHLVARLDERADGNIDCLGTADRDQKLFFGIIFKREAAL